MVSLFCLLNQPPLNTYLNTIIEADKDAINECIEYPLVYIGADSVTMLDKFPIDNQEWKQKNGWATSNGFDIDVLAVTEKKYKQVIDRNINLLNHKNQLLIIKCTSICILNHSIAN